MFSLNKISFGCLQDTIKSAEIQKNIESINLAKLNLNEIIQVNFPDNQYYREITKKNCIVLHHTVSGLGVDGDIAWWRSTVERIATAIIIGHDGKIYQSFSSKYWGHQLGMSSESLRQYGFKDYSTRNVLLNKQSIGVEIDSWGGLVESNGKWYPAIWDTKLIKNVANTKLKPIDNVELYPNGFRGYYGFEKYTDEQIEAVRKLLVYFNEKYGIILNYNSDMWDVSKNALSGKNGVWSHVSFRKDKSDCHPQKELIEMLKSLA